jgi:1,4-alpha-glucan branching enzyme
MLGGVALLLHAHLPFVRHPEHRRSLEERWLYEALWESYLPICDVLGRLAADRVRAPFTISVSPPLAAMLADDLLRRRFDDHLVRLERLASGARRFVPEPFGRVLDFYRARLGGARATWDRLGGDVLGAWVGHARAGRIELWTTAATHAYLPGIAAAPASLRAQIRLGNKAFEAIAREPPRGFWLPECGFAPSFDRLLAEAGVRVTALDAHGLELATPRPRSGPLAPILSTNGVAYLARDPDASEDVWSRKSGYPGHPAYRDFYRDVGFDLPEDALDDELGPNRARIMTGLKLHRITGADVEKEPYDAAAAERVAADDALDFVARRTERLAARPNGGAALVLAPFDAELFGHWWFEGPAFLEATLRALAIAARDGGPEPVTPAAWLERTPALEIAEPAASSWGEGGFGDVWTGPAAARLWRHVHHAERIALDALGAARHADGAAGRALDQALVELLLLEASDWAFMLHRGEMAEYAEQRVRAHATRVARLARVAIAGAASDDDEGFLRAVEQRDPFLLELRGEPIRAAFV